MLKPKDISPITLDSAPRQPLIHKLDQAGRVQKGKYIAIALVILVAGVSSGYLLKTMLASRASKMITGKSGDQKSEEVGSGDTKTFKDSAEGDLKVGGIDGEGTHKLIRPGGESQTVVLTSSVLDLSQFEGKKVKVWGETFAAQKAGWLMDVGKVEVIGK